MEKSTIESGKNRAIISYIFIVGVFIAMSMNSENKNSFASFHIRQALGLSILFISLGLLVSNFGSVYITMSMWIGISVLWVYGMFSAVNGSTKPMPIVGDLFQKYLKTIS
ncbi:hypothetical protein B0A58_12165 [Flavobacterium branchiophilum NBRC 15030 = ATCC 35035]|uniref:Putative membrane protein n=1 Tax=Flavobacterium branchiophilum TaxID=55197 RepID=A0A543FZY6_9FLAO|nr:hypothetical protein [Flavobacterium branchiophilum]OXA73050.1 hypothetical protein B0A58_12165 [Flavobacterium branchiophilum NBRC 15030 = ATCC 35035]TQM39365.1 putative membrane protein [Flavobacterium branchiophilum]GEM56164.1 membrane protein [Flavobacterium branchiophilum NBRC 15030 = ATCC 35035]